MNFPVIKASAYALIHVPTVLLEHGTTQTMEIAKNPNSEYLQKLPAHLRTFEEVVAYPPNQAYIGTLRPGDLTEIPQPWYKQGLDEASRFGPFGEIMPEDEFFALVKIVDSFDLVRLEKGFAAEMKEKLAVHPLFNPADLERLGEGVDLADVEKVVQAKTAEALRLGDRLVGSVSRAHDSDQALTSQIMYENLAAKASGTVVLRHLIKNSGIDPHDVDYIVECSEEAAGDMNQRGGGNFAKAIGEMCGLKNATGSDVRSFCAGPAHALVYAAALVQAGIYKNVVVVAGGATTKLGMNGRDHVNKEMPVLEDVLGTFAVLVSENDGVNPIIRTDVVGRHTIGSGASPQAVMTAIVTDPLDRAGISLKQIDRFAPELQNPEITVPAGAGNVPEANNKMIAALAVKRGELERSEIIDFVAQRGMPGYAPTQGHIPSGVPFLGAGREMILDGSINNFMLVGKGSLFLARLTNLFDGVSFLVEKNPGLKAGQNGKMEGQIQRQAEGASTEGLSASRPSIGVTLLGSEHGVEEILRGAEMAQAENENIEIVLIGPKVASALAHILANDEKEQHQAMERALESGELAACVTMHYNFPLGVSTVGRVITPGRGSEMLLASTTGTTASDRVEAMVKNAICGIATAKSLGISRPTVGILNVDGARSAERALRALAENGYPINFAQSVRAEGSAIMRGNDLLVGAPDVMVSDSLTGNVLMKVFSAYSSGGSYETLGYGYGPGVGERYDKIVLILSRASGAPVVANALKFAGQTALGRLPAHTKDEFAAAMKAGLAELGGKKTENGRQKVTIPAVKVTTEEIPGIDILELEDAQREVFKAGIYAATGMGCTGPVILTAREDYALAVDILKNAGYLN